MLPITALRCIYDTKARGWAMEVTVDGADEPATRRFELNGAEDAEMLIEAFEDSSAAGFDPESGEIVFSYEYADLSDLEDDEDEDEDEDGEYEEDEEDEDEEPEEDEKPSDSRRRKG